MGLFKCRQWKNCERERMADTKILLIASTTGKILIAQIS